MKKFRKDIPQSRRSNEEGHMANMIRRKMIQRDHGDKTKYDRKYTKMDYYRQRDLDEE